MKALPLVLLVLALPLPGQEPELFTKVEMVGGMSAFRGPVYGVLVLSDSGVALHRCRKSSCKPEPENAHLLNPPPIFAPYRTITALTSGRRLRHVSGFEQSMTGRKNGEEYEEVVTISFETDSNAEAPTFKVGPSMGAAIEAKIRFRMKRAGVTPPVPK